MGRLILSRLVGHIGVLDQMIEALLGSVMNTFDDLASHLRARHTMRNQRWPVFSFDRSCLLCVVE